MVHALTDIQANAFKGGSVSVLGIVENGVGLPVENPNLGENTLTSVESVKHLIQTGEIQVPATLEDTKDFLEECGMTTDFLAE